jgi:pimeloyl-ACP methyl ester carboxylesterase
MPEPRAPLHIVLVHGAWQGSWAFGAWTPMLLERGWRVHAVELPGNGWPPQPTAQANLDSYTRHVCGVVQAIGTRVVVLGHSGGGITASQVAEALPDQVAAVVYLAGMMLPDGVSYAELVRDAAADSPEDDFGGITPWLEWNAERTYTSVPAPGAMRCFLHDCDPEAARAAVALLRPQAESGRAIRNRLSPHRFGRVPRVYVECHDDRSVYLKLQRRMQQLSPGALRIELPCGHVPQLACPGLLTQRLMPEVESMLRCPPPRLNASTCLTRSPLP